MNCVYYAESTIIAVFVYCNFVMVHCNSPCKLQYTSEIWIIIFFFASRHFFPVSKIFTPRPLHVRCRLSIGYRFLRAISDLLSPLPALPSLRLIGDLTATFYICEKVVSLSLWVIIQCYVCLHNSKYRNFLLGVCMRTHPPSREQACSPSLTRRANGNSKNDRVRRVASCAWTYQGAAWVTHSCLGERVGVAAAGVTRLRKIMRVPYRGNRWGITATNREKENETHALGMQALNNRQ